MTSAGTAPSATGKAPWACARPTPERSSGTAISNSAAMRIEGARTPEPLERDDAENAKETPIKIKALKPRKTRNHTEKETQLFLKELLLPRLPCLPWSMVFNP